MFFPLWIQNCTFYSRTCQKINVKSSRKKIKTEIYESTQYHWNKKCYTFTDTDCDFGCSLHCNIFALLQFQTWGWWPPPSADRKATAPDLFEGQVPRHPHTISYAILLMDPVLHITLTMFPDTAFVYMQATSTPSLSNFYIMEFLGLMAAIPRCTARPRRSPAGGRHGTVHLPGAHRLYWISTLLLP